jgi:hypothetical protein
VIQTRTLRSKLCLSFEANVENAYDPNCWIYFKLIEMN